MEWLRRIWRSHLVFAVLLLAGVLLRLATTFAYRPALIFPDSAYYLTFAQGRWIPGTARTTAYSVLLRGLLTLQGINLVAVVQHLLGLAMAVAIYVFLVRWGCARGWAALATLPVLLDPLQVVMEHYLLTEVTAEVLVVAGVLILGWPASDRPSDATERRAGVRLSSSLWGAAIASLLLGLSAVTRSGDLLLGFVVVGFVLVSRAGWRRRVAQALIAAVAFAAPVVAYATWMDNTRGSFDLTYGYSGHFLYGRVMAFAGTTGLDLPLAERSLGPLLEPSQRNLSQLMWSPSSPSWTITPAQGMTVDQLDGDFARRVITQQPLDYLRTVAGDFFYNFAPTRGLGPERFPNWYFNFRPGYPAGVAGTQKLVHKYGGTDVGINSFLTHSLYAYGNWWTPGTLLGVLLLAGLAAVTGVGRARGSGMRLACLLICAALIGALAAPALLAGFSVRYLLPALALAPLVGVLGFTAITGKGHR
jgi:hypothetical protein